MEENNLLEEGMTKPMPERPFYYFENSLFDNFHDQEYSVSFWFSIFVIIFLFVVIIPWGIGVYKIAGKLFGF